MTGTGSSSATLAVVRDVGSGGGATGGEDDGGGVSFKGDGERSSPASPPPGRPPGAERFFDDVDVKDRPLARDGFVAVDDSGGAGGDLGGVVSGDPGDEDGGAAIADGDGGDDGDNDGGDRGLGRHGAEGNGLLPPGEGEDDEDNDMMTIDEAVDRLGCGRFQLTILFAAGLCFSADAMEITLLSFLSMIVGAEWDLSSAQTAAVTSSVFAGQLMGTIVLGRLGDVVGRRPAFLLSATIISLFGVLTAFATGYTSLLAARTIVGFGVGGLTVPFNILAEFLPSDRRGKNLLYVEYFWTAGSMAVPILAYVTYGRSGGDGSWNIFVLLCAVPCLVSAVVGAACVPESPRWLVSRGRYDEAMAVLRRAAVANGRDPIETFPLSVTIVHAKEEDEGESSSFTELFKPKWRKLTLLIWGTWFGFAFGYYGTILVVTRVFEDDSGTVGDDDVNVVPSFDYASIFISCSAEFVGTTLVVLTVDTWGRVAPQAVSYLLGGTLVLILTVSSNRGSPVAFSTFVAFCARIFEMSASCLTWVSTSEVLSTGIRSTGHSAANAVARLSAFLCPFLVEGDTPLVTVGVVMFIIHIFTAACASRLPETKGLALGEIPHGTAKAKNSSHCTSQPNGNNAGKDNGILMEMNQSFCLRVDSEGSRPGIV